MTRERLAALLEAALIEKNHAKMLIAADYLLAILDISEKKEVSL